MKKNGWIAILVILLAFVLPAVGMQIALHGKTVTPDASRQEQENGTDGMQKNQSDGLQTGEAGGGAEGFSERQKAGQSTEAGQRTEAGQGEETDQTSEVTPATPEPVSEEQKDYFLTLEAACSDTLPDGTEVRLLATDRACGSSYYTLIGVKDGECAFVNTDPFLGFGGEALFITFPDKEPGKAAEEATGQVPGKAAEEVTGQALYTDAGETQETKALTGYAGLAYSGGSLVLLYVTQDGGRNFQEIEIGEPQITLSDDLTYCPFIMPEAVYEENGKIYLIMGQGPDGDYHDETGYPSGLYLAENDGKTFRYIKNIYKKQPAAFD